MKTVAVTLLCILLFILLSIFGFAFTVYHIALSPSFVISVVDDIDLSDTARDVLEDPQIRSVTVNTPTGPQTTYEGFSEELISTVVDVIDTIEPVLKENIKLAVRDTYKYVLGGADTTNLKDVLAGSFFNSDFVNAMTENLDLPQIVDTLLTEQSTSWTPEDEALKTSIISTVTKLEPVIKQNFTSASTPIFQYFLGETETINLPAIFRQYILNKTIITEIVNYFDVKPVVKDFLGSELDFTLPGGIALNISEIDQIVAAIEPSIKNSLISAADLVADFLLGIRPNFNITVHWDISAAKPIVKQAFLRQLPADLSDATGAQIDLAFEIYWAAARSSIPSNFTIDSTIFSADLSQSIDDILSSAQESLTDVRTVINDASIEYDDALSTARPYMNLARMIYWSVFLSLLFVIAAIILVRRSVTNSCRDLGITFTVYGTLELIGVFIIRLLLGRPSFLKAYTDSDIPESIWNIIHPVIQRLTQPLFIFCVICLIIGITLLVVFFIYPRRKSAAESSPKQLPPS
jgi:hypothetical protein